jgi:hypothetical protein
MPTGQTTSTSVNALPTSMSMSVSTSGLGGNLIGVTTTTVGTSGSCPIVTVREIYTSVMTVTATPSVIGGARRRGAKIY